MKTKVLIAGGAGFIGIRVTRELLKRGYRAMIVDNFSPQIHGDNNHLPADIRDDVQLIRGDVRDECMWRRALSESDVVLNLAAETGTGQSMYQVSRYEQVNVAGTANLYQALIADTGLRVEKIIVASSRAIYGEGAYQCSKDGLVYPVSRSSADKLAGRFDPLCPRCGYGCLPVPTPEDAPLQPSSFYGLTKQVQEQMTLMFGGALEIPSFALRYQNVYGPGQSLKNPYTGILAVFSNLARAGIEINVFEDGNESRDFVYIEDVVRATVACIESDLPGTNVFNVGSNERVTVMEVANRANDYFGQKSRIRVSGDFRQGDVRHGMADIARAQNLIHFKPEWGFQDGLRAFLSWASEEEPAIAGYEQSLQEMRKHELLRGR